MTSKALKYQEKVQKWSLSIPYCRSSGLAVREWCRQRDIATAIHCRWEREILSGIRREDVSIPAAAFVELSVPLPLREASERTAALNIVCGSIDLYQKVNWILVEMLRICRAILPELTKYILSADTRICANKSVIWSYGCNSSSI